jgi:uncharacterized protein
MTPIERDGEDMGNRVIRMAFATYKKVVSPVLHACGMGQCLYLPTCSEYAYVAMSRFGVVRGSWLALRRLGRCHPWGKGGLDPVPERRPTGADHLP